MLIVIAGSIVLERYGQRDRLGSGGALACLDPHR